MGAATKVSEVFRVAEDAPTSTEDEAYTAPTKVGEGAYLAITKLMNLDHEEAHHTTLRDEDVPPAETRFESGFRARLTVDRKQRMPGHDAEQQTDDDDSLLEPTNVIAAPWIAPQIAPPIVLSTPPIAPPRHIGVEAPESIPTPDVLIVMSSPPALTVPRSVDIPVVIDDLGARHNSDSIAPRAFDRRELLVFTVAFLTTLLPAAIYLLTR